MAESSTAPASWDLAERLRSEPHMLSEYAVPLAAMLFLRWVDFQEAEAEAMAAFDETDYTPLLPIRVQWRRWHDLPFGELQSFLTHTLPDAIGSVEVSHEPLATSLRRILPAFRSIGRLSTKALTLLTEWLSAQPFETPTDRLQLLEAFDTLLDRAASREFGQFRTPASINDLLVALAAPAPRERLYDPCFGFAGILTAACRRNQRGEQREFSRSGAPSLEIAGVEIDSNSFIIGLARLALAGVATPQLELGNSLEREASTNPQKHGFDLVICNPPWGGKIDSRGLDHFPIRTSDSTSLFVQHALSQLRPGGRAVMVVPHGFLFHQGNVAELRQWLLEKHRVDAIIGLPEGAFLPYTGIKAAILVLRRNGGPTLRVRMVDATEYFEPRKIRSSAAILPQRIEDLAAAVRDATPGKNSWDVEYASFPSLDFDFTPVRRNQSGLEEILSNLGKETAVFSLKDVCAIAGGTAIKSTDLEDYPKGEEPVPYIRIGDIQHGQTGRVRSWIPPESAKEMESRFRLRPGAILVSRNGTIGKVAIVRNGAVGGVASNGFFVLTPDPGRLDLHFFAAYLASNECNSWLKDRAGGAVIKGLKKQFIEALPVPVPPLPVQQRVANDVRDHGVDALTQLSLLLSRNEDDPIANWIDQAQGLLRQPAFENDPSHILRSRLFWDGLKLGRNRAAHFGEPSTLSPWIVRLEKVADSFRNSEDVPRGPSLLSILQQGAADLNAAEVQIEGHSPLESRARELSRECVKRLKKAIELLFSDVRIVIQPKADSLPPGKSTDLTLQVRNEGVLPLRNVVIDAGEWKFQTKPAYLAERGETTLAAEVETPAVSGRHILKIEWRGFSLDGQVRSGRQEIALEILSDDAPTSASELGLSPYFVSQPVGPDRNDVFFGREAVIEQIKRQLQSGNTVLLEGNRRAGKSSILKHLEGVDRIPGCLAVYGSFQAATGADKVAGMPTETVWRTLAQSLASGMLSLGVDVPLPDGTMLKAGSTLGVAKACRTGISTDAPWEDFQDYLKQVLNLLGGLHRELVLMIDEFDKLQEGIDNGVTSPQIPENIRYLIQTQPRFAVVMTGSRRMQRLRHEYWSALFGLGNRISVSALDDASARRLVTEPVKDRLFYTDEAQNLVVALTARQPFLIQYLCNRIFEFASHAGQRSITVPLVRDAAKAFVEDNEHFASLWDYAESDRRRLLIALCHRESEAPDPLTFGVLHHRLSFEGIDVSEAELVADLKFLQELELIDFAGAEGGGVYRLTIPLMGQWLDTQQDYDALQAKARAEQENRL